MKKFHYFFLTATLALGLGLNLTACSDDDDDNKSTEQQEQDSAEGMSSIEDDVLRTFICQWCDVRQDQLTGSNWKQQRFEPTVGGVLDESTPAVRSVAVGTMEAADQYALECFNSLGINFDQPDGFTYSLPDVGAVKYSHANEGNTLAVIDVDVMQIPQLHQIQLVKEWSTNDKGDPYYQLGDIIGYDGRYYVCVSKHGYNGKARFITLNDQDDHTTGTFSWLMKGKDVVYNDAMASAETISDWISNVLLDDQVYSEVYTRMVESGDVKNMKQLIPQSVTLRKEVTELLFRSIDKDLYTDLLDNLAIEGYTWAETGNNNQGTYIAPNEFMLANKVRWKRQLLGSWHYWVPYIKCIPEKDYARFSAYMKERKSQTTMFPDYFKWSRLTEKTLESRSLVSKEVPSGKYHVCVIAMHWTHDYYEGAGDMPCYMLLDFTKDWINHPRSYISEKIKANPDSWLRRNITSNEITFSDNGTAKKDYIEISIKGRQ